MFAAVGETVIVSKAAAMTVTADVPLREVEESFAVMTAAPVPAAVTSPWEPETFETVATVEAEVDHVTLLVRFSVLPSE
jgi:hypothetical protein